MTSGPHGETMWRRGHGSRSSPPARTLTALYLFVPPFEGKRPVMNVLGLSPVLAIAAGIRLYRPQARVAWSFVAVGFVLFWLGDLYTYSYPLLLHREVPFPSIGRRRVSAGLSRADRRACIILQRRRAAHGDRGSAIDAAILTVGLALPSWVWLIAPYIHDHSLTTAGRLVSVAYPLADVLLLAVAVRLALDGGQRRVSFHLMIASIVCLLATDFVYGLMLMQGTYDHQVWLDAGWIGFYLLWGAAALHPTMAEIDQPAVQSGGVLTRFRLGLLAGASLDRADIGIVDDLKRGRLRLRRRAGRVDHAVRARRVRMAGLMRQQERSLERERMLSAAGADLVAATSREEIDEVALAAARAMAGAGPLTHPARVARRAAAAAPGSLLQAAEGADVAQPAPRDSHGVGAAGRPRPRADTRPGAPARRAAAARRRGAHRLRRRRYARRSAHSPRRSRSPSSARPSPRRCTAAAARRASARSSATPATSSP